MITLITKPHIQIKNGEPAHFDMFEAWLGEELICISRQPRLDSARELLRHGHSPDVQMTTRAHNRIYDSFVAAPIGELAKWTITERDRTGLRRERWRSYQDGASSSAVEARTRKSGMRGIRVPESYDDAVAPDRVTAKSAA